MSLSWWITSRSPVAIATVTWVVEPQKTTSSVRPRTREWVSGTLARGRCAAQIRSGTDGDLHPEPVVTGQRARSARQPLALAQGDHEQGLDGGGLVEHSRFDVPMKSATNAVDGCS